jgi:S1-C subfamily serine protease
MGAVGLVAPSAPISGSLAELTGPAPSRREMVRRILPRAVRIFVLEGNVVRRIASGVVVGSEVSSTGTHSYVLTNEHVVDPAGLKSPRLQVVIETEAGQVEYEAEPVDIVKVHEVDLSLINSRGVALSPAELAADDELAPGDEVVVVSAPYGKALSVSGGMVSLIERDPKSRRPTMLKTDAPIGYGASGGGVFSRLTGKLLAIVEGYRTAKVGFAVAQQDFSFDVPMPGETFAAPTAKLRAFLEKNGYGRLLGSGGTAVAPPESAALR